MVPDATKKDIFKAHKTIEACLQAEEGVSNDTLFPGFSSSNEQNTEMCARMS